MDRARCFKCHKLSHWARECTAHEALISEPHLPQDIHTAPTDPVSEPIVNPVQSSNVFDDEVADIAQVHCDSELFEFELCTSSPSVNIKRNLRKNFEFWKRIGAPSFILNIIERGYLLLFVSFPESAVFKNNRSSLSHAEFVEEAIRFSRVVLCKLRYRPGSLTPCLYLCKLMERRGSFLI